MEEEKEARLGELNRTKPNRIDIHQCKRWGVGRRRRRQVESMREEEKEREEEEEENARQPRE